MRTHYISTISDAQLKVHYRLDKSTTSKLVNYITEREQLTLRRFNDTVSIPQVYIVSNEMGRWYKWWVDEDLEGDGQGRFQFAWRDLGKSWKASVRGASSLVKVQTENSLNTSLQCCYYTNLLCPEKYVLWIYSKARQERFPNKRKLNSSCFT